MQHTVVKNVLLLLFKSDADERISVVDKISDVIVESVVDRVDINVEICEETFEKTKFCVGINVLSVIKSEEEGSDESLNSFEREKEKDVML